MTIGRTEMLHELPINRQPEKAIVSARKSCLSDTYA